MPTIAKKSAVITPCENICKPAPTMPVRLSVAKPIATSPMCETDEKPMTYLKSVCTLAMKAPSKTTSEARFESHRDYIDIQYLLSGEEMIGVAPVGQLQGATPYDAAKDLVFYATPDRYHELAIPPGCFAVFFPWEGHMPMCHSRGPRELHKVVIKVSLSYWQTHRAR